MCQMNWVGKEDLDLEEMRMTHKLHSVPKQKHYPLIPIQFLKRPQLSVRQIKKEKAVSIILNFPSFYSKMTVFESIFYLEIENSKSRKEIVKKNIP